jgi:hypothetical protein
MLVKSAQPGDGGEGLNALPLSLYLPSRAKVVVYAPAERAVTLPLFLLYPYMYSVQVTFSHYFCWGGGGWGIVFESRGQIE